MTYIFECEPAFLYEIIIRYKPSLAKMKIKDYDKEGKEIIDYGLTKYKQDYWNNILEVD